MKKLLFGLLVYVYSLSAFAQGEIQFIILKPVQNDLSPSVVEALDLRLKQVFNRNSAASANSSNVFAIEPVLEFSDVMSTEGMIQEVSVAKGELTLIAKNLIIAWFCR